jgi:hypothetical protein
MRQIAGSVEPTLVLEYTAFVHKEDVDEVTEQIKAILAYHGQDAGVLIKVYVKENVLPQEDV